MQSMSKLVLIFILFVQFHCTNAPKAIILKSPNKNISLKFNLKNQGDYPVYSIKFQNKDILIESELGIEFKNSGLFKNDLQIKAVCFDEKDDAYDLVFGKTATARNFYREAKIFLEEKAAPNRKIDLIFRAYNDGITFRYYFPEQENMSDFIITDELTTFNFKKNPKAYGLFWDKYENNHETNYDILPLNSIPADTLVDLPLLLEFFDSLWVAITEANLTDYASLYLSPPANRKYSLNSKLSPHINQTEIKVKASTPHFSPWRVVMISEDIKKLIESNLIVNLNDPCAFDASWIKPGKSTWHWWNGTIGEDLPFKPALDFRTMKYYIDFCAENNIEFHSLVEADRVDWYRHDPSPTGDPLLNPGPNADVTDPIPELQLERLLKYAKEKGVGIRVWVHWKALRKKLEEAFAQYEKWGIVGLMVDIMDRDDQEMVNFYHKVLKTAAKHHLKIQFHGAYKPTGLRKTYPNLVGREAVLNLEWIKWSDRCFPEHDLIVPFTRMLAGPLDYHLGGFRSVTKENFKPIHVSPNVMGTRCHHLAMYVVYESYLQLVCDYPSAYVNQPGFEFIKQVPTTWDDTKVINAKVGDYITIARRKGNDWYVGSMTDWSARAISIKLDFLLEGNYVAIIYSDAVDADKFPNKLIKEKYLVDSKDIIKCKMASGGGLVIRLSPFEDLESELPRYSN
jgi:alpha-glucosidase